MPNYAKDRDSFIIGKTYGMFPEDVMKFEMTLNPVEPSWSVFANRTNEVDILIQFNSEELDKEP